MSLRQYWREVWGRISQYTCENFPPERVKTVEECAKAAYACCVGWFGQPLDPRKPYCVQQAVAGNSFCMPMFDKYYLVLSKEAVTPEQLCSVIAHEMYHRVTTGRKGLANEMWVQEMMACLTSHWFLRKQGFQEHAEAAKKHWLGTMVTADVSAMRACRRQDWRRWILRGGDIYPDGFADSAVRTAYALIRIVDGDDLCRIVKAATLEEWIASLPEEKQYGVCRVLEVSSVGKKPPECALDLYQFLNALRARGDQAVSAAELSEITRLQPANGAAFFHLGRAYHFAKDFGSARDAYLNALALNFSDKWLPYNLATAYWHMDDFLSAATWYQEATHYESEWASASYYQGRALMKTGNIGEARKAWEHTATLSDEHYAKLAQTALEENPLPETADEG